MKELAAGILKQLQQPLVCLGNSYHSANNDSTNCWMEEQAITQRQMQTLARSQG